MLQRDENEKELLLISVETLLNYLCTHKAL